VAGDREPGTHPTHQVLIVDDNDDARDTLGRLLEMHGFTVAPAWGGEDALRHIREGFRPCAVILDLRMPGMDGWALYDRLREEPDLASVPVVIVSGHVDEMMQAENRSACQFFMKPANPDALIAAVEEHCERRQDARATAP
jgi:DNA-binding NtrC family response regulator